MAKGAAVIRLVADAIIAGLVLSGVAAVVRDAVPTRYGDPAAAGYVDIDEVPSRPPAPRPGRGASSGTARSPCGRNEIHHRNLDNPIAAPGRRDGSHAHEYVGNESTDAFSDDRSLASARTTCTNGDASAYYWPLLRVRTSDDPPGTGRGPALTPSDVLIEFRGNVSSKVVPMPRFLRLVTGDARAITAPAEGATAAQWTCVGHQDRVTSRYPVCAAGRTVVRVFDFPDCWDGRRIDSPGHRVHAVFAAADGACPRDYFPIPQVHVEARYHVPPGRSYAIDSFPDERRSPLSDHGDFINVMPERLMAQFVSCINTGRRC